MINESPLHPPHQKFTCLKPAKTTFDLTTLDFHHSIFPRWDRSGKCCFVYVFSVVKFGQILPYSSSHLGFFFFCFCFFADFHCDISGNWINTCNLCYNTVVLKKSLKLLKIAFLWPYLGKIWASRGYVQNQVQLFFWT